MSSSLLQTSDFYVSPLPKALIEKCRVMYDLYINTIQNEHNIIASPTSPTSPTTTVNNNKSSSSSSKTDEMLPSTLAKLLEDLGVPTTENDARALVFSLSQNAALQISAEESVQRKRVMEHQLLQHQQQQANSENATASPSGKRGAGNQRTGARGRATASSVDQRSNSRRSSVHSQSPRGKTAGGGGGGQHASSSSPMSFTSAAVRLEAPPPSARITLSFDMFLRVLQMPFNKSTREMEMQLLWNELDRDGDGVLSRSDIAQSIARMNGMTSKGVPKEVCESAMNLKKQNQNNNNNVNGDHEDDDDNDRLSMNSASDFGDDSSVATSNGDGDDEKNTRNKNNLHDDPHTSGRRQIVRGEATAATRTNRTALSKAFASSKPNSRSTSKTATVSKTKMTATSTSSPKNQQRQTSRQTTSSSSFDMLFQSPWMLEELSEHQLEALIHQLDSDGDGTVTFNDLKESLLNA